MLLCFFKYKAVRYQNSTVMAWMMDWISSGAFF